MDNLNKIRQKIDELDNQIVNLLNQRFDLVMDVLSKKKQTGKLVHDISREKEIIARVTSLASNPLLKVKIPDIFHAILNNSRDEQQLYLHESFPFKKVGIIGLGLMGGSFAKTIKAKDESIYIMASDPLDHTEEALKESNINEISSIEHLVEKCDLIIISTPLPEIIPIAKRIANEVHLRKEKLLVIDIGSVKKDICEEFQRLSNDKVEFLSTHPMAGKETFTYQNSDMSLTANAIWIIIPHAHNTPESIAITKNFIQYLGSLPVLIENGVVHDFQLAFISHIPAFLAGSYYRFVKENHPESINVAGPSFKSFTRLAHDNPEMWDQIHSLNKSNVISGIKSWLNTLQKDLDSQ